MEYIVERHLEGRKVIIIKQENLGQIIYEN